MELIKDSVYMCKRLTMMWKVLGNHFGPSKMCRRGSIMVPESDVISHLRNKMAFW